LLFQLQLFYNEQSKYIHMFDMVNRLMSCHFQSFLHAPEQLFDRTGMIYTFAAVFVLYKYINMRIYYFIDWDYNLFSV